MSMEVRESKGTMGKAKTGSHQVNPGETHNQQSPKRSSRTCFKSCYVVFKMTQEMNDREIESIVSKMGDTGVVRTFEELWTISSTVPIPRG